MIKQKLTTISVTVDSKAIFDKLKILRHNQKCKDLEIPYNMLTKSTNADFFIAILEHVNWKKLTDGFKA